MEGLAGITRVASIPILFVLAGLFLSLLPVTSSQSSSSLGPNWETLCSGGTCQTTLYSYEKYFFNGQEWEEIDENWYDCSQGEETQFCTNEYHFNTIAKSNGTVSSYFNNEDLTVQLSNFLKDVSLDGFDFFYNQILYGKLMKVYCTLYHF